MQNSNDEYLRPEHPLTVMDLPLAAVTRLYGLELSLLEKIPGGYLSENYALTNGATKYFLKKHRLTDRKEVEGVYLAERFFAEGGIPVILPLATKEGAYFFEENTKYYALYPFVSGHHIERGKLSETAAASLGATLAVLHKRGKDSTLSVREHFNAWDKEKFLAKAAAIESEITKKSSSSDFDGLVLKSLALKKGIVQNNTITYEQLSLQDDHLIHGDYFCDNVFFDKNDHISYVFDFEKTQYAPPLYELFRSLFVSFLSIPSQENLSIAKKYVDAYLGAYQFPKSVVRSSFTAAYLKQMHSIWIEEEHYLKHSNRTDDLLPSQYACNEYCVTNRAAIEAFLL